MSNPTPTYLNMNTTTTTAGPVESQDFIQNVVNSSAIWRLTEKKRISAYGESVPVFPSLDATEVGETQLKPTNDKPVTSLVAKGATIVAKVNVSNKLLFRQPELEAIVATQGAAAICRAIDNKIAGNQEVLEPTFGQLSEATGGNVELNTVADLNKAIALVLTSGSKPTGIYMDSAFYSHVNGLRNGLGTPIFQITPGATGGWNSGVIEGIPYSVYLGTAGKATLGDFAGKAVAGTVYDFKFDINQYGMSGEGANAFNLFDRNMIGLRIEVEVAFNFIKDAFVNLTIPAGDATPSGA